ncbi:MAG TPA: M14 family zinc carboxypeptidase [Holophaga sp.]|nr:M14 family zinc carboxypeptidase [Holophaga sp.]
MRAAAALLAALPVAAQALLPGRDYRGDIPRPEAGAAYTSDAGLAAALANLQGARDRVRAFTYHVTEEGRPQVLLAISSPGNISRLDALKAANARLADPRGLAPAEAADLAARNPVFVWLGFSVHGNEAAGTEAALQVAWHFAASRDPETLAQLSGAVLLLDVTQNPDGRARHLQAVAEVLQGANPADPQDAQNTMRWPSGRFNHRLFDLNRDWAWQTQAETRARTAQFLAWNPQVLADFHEMMPEQNYFFPPGMAPVHQALSPAFGGGWQRTFGEALGAAFDKAGWRHFSREVFDLFYPSYGDSWGSFQGAVGMTYECPNPGGLAYLRKDGELLTLESRVRRHVTAALATVAVASSRRADLLRDWVKARQDQAAKGDKAGAFLVAPGDDPGRARALVDLLRRNGIEVHRTAAPVDTAGLEPILPGARGPAPAGSWIVPLDQPRASLAVALLERSAAFGAKPSYDATAWSLPLAFNVPAWRAPVRPRVALDPKPEALAESLPAAAYGYAVLSGAEGRDRILAALLGQGFRGAALPEPVQVHGRTLPAGTAVFPAFRNPGLEARLRDLAARNPGCVVPLESAAVDEGPDLASPKALTLKAPRVAVVMDAPADPTSAGAIMHTLREAGLPFTQLRASRLAGADLRRYTHVILPDDHGLGRNWMQVLGSAGVARLKAHGADGGVLVALQGGAAFAARAGLTDAGVSFLSRRDEEARLKEKDPKREAAAPPVEDRVVPWSQRDDKALQETIPGAMLKAEVDLTHPLGWGLGTAQGAVLDSSDPVLDLSPGGENPLRFGKGPLVLSGLAPKAMEARLQQTAWALRERKGKGAVILFAGDPVHRGCAPFTTRAFMNALFFGAYAPADEDE